MSVRYSKTLSWFFITNFGFFGLFMQFRSLEKDQRLLWTHLNLYPLLVKVLQCSNHLQWKEVFLVHLLQLQVSNSQNNSIFNRNKPQKLKRRINSQIFRHFLLLRQILSLPAVQAILECSILIHKKLVWLAIQVLGGQLNLPHSIVQSYFLQNCK